MMPKIRIDYLGHISQVPPECKHKIVIINEKLECEYCGETFKF